MRRLSTALAFFILLGACLSGAAADRPKLPDRYKKWLDEEVVYIITSVEKDVFLKLQTDRERDLFIDAFWKHRDPTPDTPENEFKTEHYRRIEYANRYLGREAPFPGWKTDRGRMYILLGEPQEIQSFTEKSGIYDAITWFYQGKTDLGLPEGFYLLFFKERGMGAFRLYSPSADGPQALLSTYSGDPSDYQAAYQALQDIDPNLADISMNLIPGEQTSVLGRPSLASTMLIQQIETLPSRAVKDQYARRFLEYKDRVEVEYSANYLASDSLVKVFRDATGTYFVHFAVEPQRLSVNQYENKYYTTLDVSGRVTTLEDRPVFQYDRTVSLNMTEAQMKDLRRAPFNYHDLFPLVPGDYKVSILIKNQVSKEFVSMEQAVRIPANGTGLQLTQPLLGYKVNRVDPSQRKMKAFKLGPYEIYCQPGRVFTASDTLAVAFQVNNLSAEQARSTGVKISITKDGQTVREVARKASDYPELPNAVEEISLAGFLPAHYGVRVAVLNAGAEVVSANDEFDLTFAASVGRPWFSSRILPEPGDPIYDQLLGTQLFNLRRYDEARVFEERAFERRPDSPDLAGNLAQIYLALGRNPDVIRVLAPFLNQAAPPKYDMFVLAGEAYKRSGDFAKALEILNQAVTHYGVNASLLKAIGDAYLGQGKVPEALAAYEKSLQLSPAQPELQKKIAELKTKR